jgi:hypothetical protein
MRYSKSSVLAIALAVACSAADCSAVANAQDAKLDFPWRSKTSVRSVAKTAKSAVNAVQSSFATPARDLTTSQTIATPTPSFESMPSVIYDEGKKYIRQGDTYIESSNVGVATTAGENFNSYANAAVPMPAAKKSSWFQKTKDLTGRLNPFSNPMRSETAYRASNWQVPSFSDSLPSFSKKDDDPITFAAATPLPAKSSVPSALDNDQEMFASKKSYSAPAASSSVRDSQFQSALPTETRLTSVFSTEEEDSSSKDFNPVASTVGKSSGKAELPKIPSSFSSKTKVRSSLKPAPKAASVASLPEKPTTSKSSAQFSTKTRINSGLSQSDFSNSDKGFSYTQQTSSKVSALREAKSAPAFSAKPTVRSTAGKTVSAITKKVSQDSSPVAEVSPVYRRQLPKIESQAAKSQVARPVRVAHELSAENDFWTPKR